MTSHDKSRLIFLVVTLVALTALLMVVTLSVAAGETQQTPSENEPAPAGDANHGKEIFASYGCYQCHGYLGQGATRTGAPRIAPDPIPFALFRYIVREPPEEMPPYTEKVLSDDELADIYAYLQSVPQPPDPESLPELK